MKVIQVNVTYGVGSTGVILDKINDELLNYNHQSYISFGRGYKSISKTMLFKHSNHLSVLLDAFLTRVTGVIGYFSLIPTIRLIRHVKRVNPDVIHLHNLHGYHLNLHLFFKFLHRIDKPIIITLHDEFLYTGKCAYTFECIKYQTICNMCPQLKEYPKTLFFDKTNEMHTRKIDLLNTLNDVIYVVPSNWSLEKLISSKLKVNQSKVIRNGVDLSVFYKREGVPEILSNKKVNKKAFLAVINDYNDPRKGFDWILKVSRSLINKNSTIVVVGSGSGDYSDYDNLVFVGRVYEPNVMAELYSFCDALLMFSRAETFGMVCLEAAACGTKTIGFNVGGVKDAVSHDSVLFKYGDEKIINYLDNYDESDYSTNVKVDETLGSKYMARKYIELYEEVISKNG